MGELGWLSDIAEVKDGIQAGRIKDGVIRVSSGPDEPPFAER